MTFTEHFDSDHTGDWLDIGTQPGLVQDGAIFSQAVHDDTGLFSSSQFAYVVPFDITSGGRVGYKAIYPGSPTQHTDRAGLGITSADFSQIGSFVVGNTGFLSVANATVTLAGADFATESEPHGLTFNGLTYWFTIDLSADLKTLTGGVWTSEPPLTGGTPLQSYDVTNASPLIGPLSAFFIGGGGPHLTGPYELDADTHYDDWFAVGTPGGTTKIGNASAGTHRHARRVRGSVADGLNFPGGE